MIAGDPIGQGVRAIAEGQVPWDELRERRVLAQIEARLGARSGRRTRASTRPWGRIVGVALGIAAVATLVLGVGWTLRGTGATQSVAELRAPATLSLPAKPEIPDQMLPMLRLSDGSTARMHNGANVDVEVQTSDLVRLVQQSGSVHYEVTPNPARRFVVDAAGVEVRVIGTVFNVSINASHVEVEVIRGRVAVEDSERVAELAAGDRLRVERNGDEVVVLDGDDPAQTEDEPEPEPEDDGHAGEGPSRGQTHGTTRKPSKAVTHPQASAEQLLARADDARAQGQLGDAASALSELVRRYPKDARAYATYFQLGKVERNRGHHAAAASAFSACYKRAPAGALSEDARAEAAASWGAAGQRARAVNAAKAYMDLHPEGAHAARMRRILDKNL